MKLVYSELQKLLEIGRSFFDKSEINLLGIAHTANQVASS